MPSLTVIINIDYSDFFYREWYDFDALIDYVIGTCLPGSGVSVNKAVGTCQHVILQFKCPDNRDTV